MTSMIKKTIMLLPLLIVGSINAQVKLPTFFSDNMVLQQGIEIPVWGWASPGEKVTVNFDKKSVSTKADKTGKWSVKLNDMDYGGPYTMTVKGKDLHTLVNIMIGEVWVCSGQSNMEFYLRNAMNAEEEIASANYSNIRLFTVKKRIAQNPLDQLEDGEWVECSTSSSPDFSAVAYFFGKSLYEKLKVPIGLINTSWGGTVAETWTSSEMIAQNPDFEIPFSQLKRINLEDYANTIEKEIRERVGEFSTVDQGMKGNQPIWAATDLDDSDWKTMKLPGIWEHNGLEAVDGIVWFRKEVTLSQTDIEKGGTINLGKINDSDNTFFNGILIGSNKMAADKLRSYTIPSKLLKLGRNVITVQVEDVGASGGIYGNPTYLYLKLANRKISLAGSWKYKVGLVRFSTVLSPNSYPTLLYNAMINPLIPYGIKGVIWYQGEGNASRAKQYQRVFPDLIKDWRNHWNQGDFPFLFVQLANFMEIDTVPVESEWAELREAQSKTLDLPNTGMAVTTDVGDALDIHPKDKQTVGNRLAISALKVAYKKDIISSGPVYKGMNVSGAKIILTFDEVGNGLKAKDKYGYLKGFAVAGENHKFYWAKAVITGINKIEVFCPEVQHPVAVRYGWGNNPEDANLYNIANLPASPFRTDQWRGITE